MSKLSKDDLQYIITNLKQRPLGNEANEKQMASILAKLEIMVAEVTDLRGN